MGKTVSSFTVSEPPDDPRTKYDWAGLARLARRVSPKWVLVFEEDRASLVVAINQGGIVALKPEKGFKTKTANNTKETPRTCSLWVRYDPDLDTSGEG